MIAKGVLPEFQNYLLSHKLATQKNVLYLAMWVSKFLAFSNGKGRQDLQQTLSGFLNSLEAKAEIQDWQVRQAEEAVRLYLNHFRGGEELKALSEKKRLEGCLSNNGPVPIV